MKKGQLLMEADLEGIQAAGLDTITPVLVCNCDEFSQFQVSPKDTVTNQDTIITLNP